MNQKKNSRIFSSSLDITSFDGARLSGTLDMPARPKALLVPVHGSLVQTRDGDLDGSKTWMFPRGAPKRKLFIDISQTAAQLGIGTYRYDKRASGSSEGVYAETNLEVLAKDVITICNKLKTLYPNLPIGLLGQSEGTLTILRVNQLGMKPHFMVLQGPALEPLEVFMEHQRTRAAAPFLKDSDSNLAKTYPYLSALYKASFQGDLLDKILNSSDKYYQFRSPGWEATESLEKLRHYRWDGLKMLKDVRCPTLIAVGSLDNNVPPSTCQKIKQAQESGMYSNARVHILDGLEHSFRPCKPGENWVKVMGRPISPKYITVLRNFLKSTLNETKTSTTLHRHKSSGD